MAYPQNIDSFTNKLNKLDDNTYVIEETAALKDGVYEGELQHDNVSLTSINVYTGSRLTGTKVKNVIVSTPSAAPWKRNIKIFSEVSPVYITYETTGDTVEADDINKVQDSLVNIENEVERYKGANDLRVSNIEGSKAEKTYVDTEFLTKADKSDIYTKEETDGRIQNIIGTAPSNLDTLQELAKALDNDANYASTVTTELAQKVDKVTGKQLSTEDYTTTEKTKLAGVQDNANNYVHPTSHPAAMITEDSIHRWTTDDEKALWNTVSSKSANGHKHTKADITDFPVSFPIDGGNADTVDGKHASSFIPNVTDISNTNLNDLLTTGFYQGYSVTNAPTSGWYYFVSIKYLGDGWCVQYAVGFGYGSTGNSPNNIYMRAFRAGTWDGWTKVLTNKTVLTWNDLKGVD